MAERKLFAFRASPELAERLEVEKDKTAVIEAALRQYYGLEPQKTTDDELSPLERIERLEEAFQKVACALKGSGNNKLADKSALIDSLAKSTVFDSLIAAKVNTKTSEKLDEELPKRVRDEVQKLDDFKHIKTDLEPRLARVEDHIPDEGNLNAIAQWTRKEVIDLAENFNDYQKQVIDLDRDLENYRNNENELLSQLQAKIEALEAKSPSQNEPQATIDPQQDESTPEPNQAVVEDSEGTVDFSTQDDAYWDKKFTRKALLKQLTKRGIPQKIEGGNKKKAEIIEELIRYDRDH